MNGALITDGGTVMKKFEIQKRYEEIMVEFNKRHSEFGAIESLIASITPIQDYTAHEITEAIVNISSYLTRTGVIIAAYTSNANETYHYRKYQYAWEFNSLKSKIDSDTQKMFTDKKADSKAIEAIFKTTEDELLWRRVADELKAKEKSFYTFVTVCQSRVRVIGDDKVNSNY